MLNSRLADDYLYFFFLQKYFVIKQCHTALDVVSPEIIEIPHQVRYDENSKEKIYKQIITKQNCKKQFCE